MVGDIDISDSIQRGINELFAFIPELIAAILILIVGWIIASWLGKLVARVLRRAGFDRVLHEGQAGSWVQRATGNPSQLVGMIVKWAVILGVISLAVSVLGISALSAFVGEIFEYLPNVIAALLIFLVAGAIAGVAATLASRFLGDSPLGKIVGTAAPILVMAIATFMILDQLQIAPDIVRITYALVLGAVALGSALAFGLGGRDVAREMLMGAYRKGQAAAPEMRSDAQQAAERARAEASEARARMQEGR